MSDLNQITAALNRIFNEEGKRIVFWHDPDREFLEFVDNRSSLLFDHTTVNVVRLDQASALETKIRLEREDPTGRYLLYAPTDEPDYENDWLLDIRLYSRSFRADRASIILDELGLANQHLRQHLADRRKFFDNKEQLQKLKPLVAADDTATDLDRKLIAVVVKADQPELFTIIRTLFHAYTEGDDIDLDTPVPAWEYIEKFDLVKPFWLMTKTAFGYVDEDPSLKKFLVRLLVTDYAAHLKAELPAALGHLVLPPLGRSNAIVCLAQWRDSNSKGSSYDRLSARVAPLLKLEDHLHGLVLLCHFNLSRYASGHAQISPYAPSPERAAPPVGGVLESLPRPLCSTAQPRHLGPVSDRLVDRTPQQKLRYPGRGRAGGHEQQLQHLLTGMAWDEADLNRQRVQVMRGLRTERDGVLSIDDTGFAKQGRHSVGVARQYSGTLGKVGNCQVTVNCHYAERTLAWPVVTRLHLPQAWAEDEARRQAAHVPEEVTFQTKAELALALIAEAKHCGVRHACVVADADYGDNPLLLYVMLPRRAR
jgi:DDE superfamily endonuclease